VNGDGFDDVVVGDVGPTLAGVGRVWLFMGSASGVVTTPATTLEGIVTTDHFGYALASLGDGDGDGYDDLVVSTEGTGTVAVYPGSADGLLDTASVEITKEYSGEGLSVGDVNGDTLPDLVVASPARNQGEYDLYLGTPTGLSDTSACTTASPGLYLDNPFVTRAGDLNGDGLGDFVVGDETGHGGTAVPYVFLGAVGGPSTTPAATLAVYRFGNSGDSVGAAGDVDGDGYDDLVLVSASETGDSLDLYRGDALGLETTPSWSLAWSGGSDGLMIAPAGDLDHDGLDDVLIGDAEAGAGEVYVLHGAADGLASPLTLAAPDAPSMFGRGLGAGDVDGDGWNDVLVGARSSDDYTGRVYVFGGSADGLSTTPSQVLTGESHTDFFGSALAITDARPWTRERTRGRTLRASPAVPAVEPRAAGVRFRLAPSWCSRRCSSG